MKKFIHTFKSMLWRVGIGRYLARFNNRNDREWQAILREVLSGDHIWDVGANVGHYTVRFAQIVGKTGRVTAFEPGRMNADRLRRLANNFANLSVFEIALSDGNGVKMFEEGADERAGSSRVVSQQNSGSSSYRVETRTADKLLADEIAGIPRFVKIDVEGHELNVLLGMTNLLENKKLRTLIIELHPQMYEEMGRCDEARQIRNLLTKAGFAIEMITSVHILARR